MRNKHCKLIAIVLAALLVVGLFPANLLTSAEAVESAGNTTADDGVSDETAGDITTQETERSSDDLADWTDTGLQNADGTPVTAQQGDTAGNSGAVTSSDTSVLSEDTPDSYTLTLDLDGGQVNGLQGAGWTRSSASSYTWYYTVTAGDNLTPDDTLGGLLPSAPLSGRVPLPGLECGRQSGHRRRTSSSYCGYHRHRPVGGDGVHRYLPGRQCISDALDGTGALQRHPLDRSE